MEVVPTFVEPLANLRSFVVCRVIMNQIDGSWFVTRGQAFEEMDIGLCVKDAVLMVKETRVVQIDRAEYLLGMTLAGRGNQRLGYVYRCHRCCCALSAWARRRFGRCTEKPSSWRSFRTWPGW